MFPIVALIATILGQTVDIISLQSKISNEAPLTPSPIM